MTLEATCSYGVQVARHPWAHLVKQSCSHVFIRSVPFLTKLLLNLLSSLLSGAVPGGGGPHVVGRHQALLCLLLAAHDQVTLPASPTQPLTFCATAELAALRLCQGPCLSCAVTSRLHFHDTLEKKPESAWVEASSNKDSCCACEWSLGDAAKSPVGRST